MIVVGSACFVDGFERMARKSAYFVEEWMVIEKRQAKEAGRGGNDLHDLITISKKTPGLGGVRRNFGSTSGGSVSSRHVLCGNSAGGSGARGSFSTVYNRCVSVFTLQVSPHARPDRVVQRKIRISCILT